MTTNVLILLMMVNAFTCATGARKLGIGTNSFDNAEAFPFSGAIGSDTLGAGLPFFEAIGAGGDALGSGCRRFGSGAGLGGGLRVGLEARESGAGFGGCVIIGGRGAAAGVGGGFGARLP